MRVVLSNVKAHLVVMLVVFLATSLAIGDATHEGVVHHPHVIELLHMAPPSALSKRHLRSIPGVMNLNANGVEERANIAGGAATATKIEEKIVQGLNRLTWWLTKNPDALFASLKLQNIKVGLLSNTKFLKWEALVKKKYGRDADEEIMKTMIGQCEDVPSEAMVVFGVNNPWLYKDLLSKWEARKKKPEQLLRDLNPGGDVNALINNIPLLQAWSEFAKRMGLSIRERLDILTKAYTVPGVVQALSTATKDIEAEKNTNKVTNKYAEGLLQQQLRDWYDVKMPEAEVLKNLQIDKADTTSKRSLVSAWLVYVLMRSLGDKHHEDVEPYRTAVLEQLTHSTVQELLGKEMLSEVTRELRTESYNPFLARHRRATAAHPSKFPS